MSTSSYGDSVHDLRDRLRAVRRVEFDLGAAREPWRCAAGSSAFRTCPPTRPAATSAARRSTTSRYAGCRPGCEATGIEKVVIGVSGGLDSTHALIVAARAMDRLGLPRDNVLGYTLPGFATSARTLRNAHALMKALGVSATELDIRPSATQMLRDLGHPAADGGRSTTSPMRTSRRASAPRTCSAWPTTTTALVLGTGDLSELALGWATYGVGDQMSHYSVNASVPKTLIQFMIRWAIDTGQFGARGRGGPRLGAGHRDLARAGPARRRAGDGPDRTARASSGPTSCRTSSSTTSCASATARARWPSWPSPPGATATVVTGRPDPGAAAATSTRWRRSSTGSRSSCSASSRPASSSARPCPTPPRSARADRCRPARTGARPATARRRLACGASFPHALWGLALSCFERPRLG